MSNCLAGAGGSNQPDLSHLTAEERLIIQEVLARQRAEEQKERDLLKRKTDEVKQLESNLVTKIGQNARNPLGMLLGGGNQQNQQQQQHLHQQQQQMLHHQQQPQQQGGAIPGLQGGAEVPGMGPTPGGPTAPPATCQLCLKTKFADGVGHICNYCNVRCCARCGGKVSLRSNKVIWVCILCRKKQELLIKTGQWISQPLSAMNPMSSMNPQMAGGQMASPGSIGLQGQLSGQANQPMSISILQRARSVEIPSSGPTMGSGMAGNAASMATTAGGMGGLWRGRMGNSFNEYDPYQQQNLMIMNQMQPIQNQIQIPGSFGYSAQSRRGEFRRQLSAGNAEQGGHYYQQAYAQQTQQVTQAQSHQNLSQAGQQSGGFGVPLLKNSTANLSNSFQTLFSRPFGKGQPQQQQQQQQHMQIQASSVGYNPAGPCGPMGATVSQIGIPGGMGSAGILDPTFPAVLGSHPNLTNPGATAGGMAVPGTGSLGNQLAVTNARTRGGMLRNDSLSSDQSHAEPHTHQHRRRHSRKLGKKKKRSSTSGMTAGIRTSAGPRSRSSSDEELHSDCSSCGSIEDLDCDYRREEMLDAKIKKFLANPVSWKPSTTNPEILIGHMILKKLPSGLGSQTDNAAQMLGLKVVGGKILRNSRSNKKQLGAIIERVKKGSIADVVGHLKPGDQVLEWNGRSLKNKTYEEVFEIILASSQDLQVELIVSRPLVDGEDAEDLRKEVRRHSSAALSASQANATGKRADFLRKTCSTTYLPPSSVGGSAMGVGDGISSLSGMAGDVVSASRRRSITSLASLGHEVLAGRIQIKLWYDAAQLQLVVTVVGAADLPPRLVATGHSGSPSSMNLAEPRNPYAKLFLLPDRSEKSKRRTKTIADSNEPYWNQTFVYSPLRRSDLMQRALEVTVWDYDRYGANDFLGEAVIDLANINIPFQDDINEDGDWYLLSMESSRYNGTVSGGVGSVTLGGSVSGHTSSASALRATPRSSSAMLTTRRLMTSPSARWYSEGEELSEWEAASLDEFECQQPSMYLDSSGRHRQRVGSLDTLNLQSGQGGFSRRRPSFGRPGLLGHRGDTSFLHAAESIGPHGGHLPSHHGGAGFQQSGQQLLQQQHHPGSSSSKHHHNTKASVLLRGPSPVYASDSELGVQSSSYYSERERDRMDHYGDQISQRGRPDRDRHRESSLDRWEQPHVRQQRADPYRRDPRDMRDLPHGHSQQQHSEHHHQQQHQRESSVSSLQREPLHEHREHRDTLRERELRERELDRNRDPGRDPCGGRDLHRDGRGIESGSRGSLQHRASFQQERGDGREREGSIIHESVASRHSSSYQRGLESGREERDSRDHVSSNRDQHHRDSSASISRLAESEQPYDQHRGSFDRTSNREQHIQQSSHHSQQQQHQSRGSMGSATAADQYSQQHQQQQQHHHHHRQSLSHSHAPFYGDSPQRERERERERDPRSSDPPIHHHQHYQHGSTRLHDDGRDRSERDRSQSAYYSDRGLESDGSETSSVISKLSSTTQSEALHRGPSDRRQSSGQRASQQTSRTLSEFTLQKSQGGPVHPLSSSGRGSSNESSSMSMTMTRESRESYVGLGGRDAGRGGDRRDAVGRRAESIEESTRTSSQSVSEAKEGSEEGSLSDTTTANEEKLGGSSFEIADTSPYSTSPYANAKINQSQAAATPQQKSKGARLGFRNRRKNKVGRGVHRSEEVAPDEVRHLVRQASSVSSDGEGSLSGDSATTWGASSVRGAPSVTSVAGPIVSGSIVEGLGPGQIVGRQTLSSPSLGDIQMSFCDRKGNLEVEVIRAKGLQPLKVGPNALPAPCVKVYLVRTTGSVGSDADQSPQGVGRAGQLPIGTQTIVAKAKTTAARRTLDPLFQQQLIFHEDYRGCLLQVTVWGDYGSGDKGGERQRTDRVERKVFMGMAQIALDDLDLGRIVIGWYKLFNPTSVVNAPSQDQ
ncbi:regulating synaptic membrane exocytosis protein 1-like isoform X2 [Varroa destructor]|uniref:Regulating synaptic membrane exocytosis protein 2 n=1 Tax=Varroa destructor TaxID=109461 RepID=A0A7M7J6S8_VARDE|nr:regulating synaptic membrane exocytosis protein 1-like isoform X2 [Varroa destructor]